MTARTRVDEKGRITLPKEIRRILGIRTGDELSIKVVGNKVILEKTVNPFQKLGELLGNITFQRELRYNAEEEALKTINQRLRKHEEKSPA